MNRGDVRQFNPKTCISGKVMRIGRVTANIFRKYLSPFGVTDSQTSLLFVLSQFQEGMNQKRLSEIQFMEKSTLNRNLTRLLKEEYVTKDAFPLIQITPKGIDLVERIIPAWDEAMNEIRTILGEDGEAALQLVSNKITQK